MAQAAMNEGKNIQAFPFYGPERSGAPTKAYVRISNDPIRQHEPVTDPDLVIVLDETLLASQDVSNNLDRDESLIINTKKSAEEVRKEVSHFQGAIHTIDALGIALNVTGAPAINSVILGKLVKVSEIVNIESIISEFRELFTNKIGKELTEKNVKAIQEGYDAI